MRHIFMLLLGVLFSNAALALTEADYILIAKNNVAFQFTDPRLAKFMNVTFRIKRASPESGFEPIVCGLVNAEIQNNFDVYVPSSFHRFIWERGGSIILDNPVDPNDYDIVWQLTIGKVWRKYCE